MRELIKEILKESEGTIEFNRTDNPQKTLQRVKNSVELKLKKVYLDVVGEELVLPKIDIKIDDDIKDGKDEEYLKWVITHELIHASVGEDLPKDKEHGGLFKKMASGMGLPKEYWD
jgi:predicted SprT family Zn-dependent metalloprotease